jgi:aminopeptidase N
MKNYLILITLVVWHFDLLAQSSDSIKKLPPARWARVRSVDVKHIALDIQVDWTKKQVYGTATITLAPLQNTREIKLDAGMLSIASVKLPDESPLQFTYNDQLHSDGLVIQLNRIYQSGENVNLKIVYQTNWNSPSDPNSLGGTNGKGLRFFGPTSTEANRRQQLWTMGEPEGNRFWFPCYDAPNDLRTTEIKITVDRKFTALSNGRLVDNKELANGMRVFHYKTDVPYANHLTSLIVGEYIDVQQKFDQITLYNYSLPDEVEATTASVAQLPEMIRYFSEVTGKTYPYESYSQAFVQDLPWGVGGNMLSTQTENMVDDARTHDDFLYLWDDLEGETLAQQWFGNYLTPADWSHSWLSKSFGRYFSELYDQHKNGDDEFHLYPRNWDRSFAYLPTWNSGYRRPLVTNHYEDAAMLISDSYSGFHGAQVLHMLRKQLGDETWWKAIKLYVKTNANKLVTTEDFRKAVEEASGEPMDWFFDQWVYKMGHPVFEVTKTYNAISKELFVTVRQTQKADRLDRHPKVDFFQGKIEIEIDERIETVWLEAKEQNVFRFALPQEPKLVNFDYQDTWVKEMRFEKSLDELLHQFKNDRDILGKRWAGNELFNLAKNESTTLEDKEKIYAAYRNVISSNCYWRFKFAFAIPRLQSLLAPVALQQNPIRLDEATRSTLVSVIRRDKAWVRSSALFFLGMTRDPAYADLYISLLQDSSDRVINAAAIALGKSKSPKAFPALKKLVNKPSWKNQSLLSSLFALQQLEDPRGYDIAYKALADLTSPHWVLAVPIWDYRIIAAQTIKSLHKSRQAYPLLLAGFKKAMNENDIHGIFYTTLLIAELGDIRGLEIFDSLKTKYKDDTNAMVAVEQYENQLKEATKK